MPTAQSRELPCASAEASRRFRACRSTEPKISSRRYCWEAGGSMAEGVKEIGDAGRQDGSGKVSQTLPGI